MSVIKRLFPWAGFVTALMLAAPPANAGIVVGGTRVVYDGGKRAASISVKNNSRIPYVVQAWLDDGDQKSHAKTPFVVTPPIFRLDAGKENILRIIYLGQGLPEDRESVYWLNVQEIPPKPEQENVLQIAVRTRIKLFYRPPALAKAQGGPAQAAHQLRWKLVFDRAGAALVADNPTPYAVNLAKVTLNGVDKKARVEAEMVPPLTKRQ